MQIRGPLMKEHRIIEKMLEILGYELKRLEKGEDLNPDLIRDAVDFFRFYADRTHHGKEEDILFTRLKDKPMTHEEQKIMNRLIQEHEFARIKVREMEEANQKYIDGDKQAVNQIIDILNELLNMYPEHVDIEDNHFFEPVMKYFNDEESETILVEYNEFDESMIHERYEKMIDQYK